MRRPLSHAPALGALATLAALALPSVARAHEDAPVPGHGVAAEVTTTDPGDESIRKWAARFKGSILILDQSVTPDTLSPQVQLSAVPSYQWWFSFRPRFYITPTLSIRGRADLTIEVLNGSDTTYAHQPPMGRSVARHRL
jgi:hypothetical protein